MIYSWSSNSSSNFPPKKRNLLEPQTLYGSCNLSRNRIWRAGVYERACDNVTLMGMGPRNGNYPPSRFSQIPALLLSCRHSYFFRQSSFLFFLPFIIISLIPRFVLFWLQFITSFSSNQNRLNGLCSPAPVKSTSQTELLVIGLLCSCFGMAS